MNKEQVIKELEKLKINFTDGGILIVLNKKIPLELFSKVEYNGKFLKFTFSENTKMIILPPKVNKLIVSLKQSKKQEVFITNEDKYLENIKNLNEF